AEKLKSKRYDLICNIVHDGEDSKNGVKRAYVLHKANNKWYETHDLNINESIAQLVSVAESYIQIWELKDL
ncbi:U4/U6.U5 tri-snRNP-associated protein 2, partial [Bonamia ostreae]